MGDSFMVYQSGRLGVRHGLMLISFTGNMLTYCTRVGLSVAMVAMVNPSTTVNNSAQNSTSAGFFSQDDVCPQSNTTFSESGNKAFYSKHKFEWNSETQGFLHGAFYYGYLMAQIPGGWVAHKIGAKLPIALSMIFIGIFSVLSPLAADSGVAAFFTVRLLIGIGQGVIFPSMTVLWSQWAPPLERGRLLSVTYSGCQLGTVVGMSVSGLLAQSFDWESIFYCFGTASCLWVIAWFFLAFNTPEQHPRISVAERKYILKSIKYRPTQPEDLDTFQQQEQDLRVPWLPILKNVPIYALLAVEFGHSWGFDTLLAYLPTYLNNILHFSLKSNGFLSAMPYLVRLVVTLLTVNLADWMMTNDIWSVTMIRKFFSVTAFLGTAGGLVGVALVGCDQVAAVVLFTVSVSITGLIYGGYIINYAEMSPKYCGILTGMGKTVGTLAGIAASYLVGMMTSGPSGQTVKNWQNVFFISAAVYLATALVYGALGSSKRQKWDQPVQSATIKSLL